MNDSPQAHTAIDVIRCTYLASVAEQKGYREAARRWRQMTVRWLNQQQRTNGQGRSVEDDQRTVPDDGDFSCFESQ